jgi:hypothetical protein
MAYLYGKNMSTKVPASLKLDKVDIAVLSSLTYKDGQDYGQGQWEGRYSPTSPVSASAHGVS